MKRHEAKIKGKTHCKGIMNISYTAAGIVLHAFDRVTCFCCRGNPARSHGFHLMGEETEVEQLYITCSMPHSYKQIVN